MEKLFSIMKSVKAKIQNINFIYKPYVALKEYFENNKYKTVTPEDVVLVHGSPVWPWHVAVRQFCVVGWALSSLSGVPGEDDC